MQKLSRVEREQQEREAQIISTAEKLFSTHGFENVSMDMIARESEYTKRTVYHYFQSKDDLFFAAALKGHQCLHEMIAESQVKGETGLKKIRHFYCTYYQYIAKYPVLAQLVNKRRYVRDESVLGSPFYQKFMALDRDLFAKLRETYQQGVEDGSIRADLDIDLLAYSTIYIAVGFFQLFSFSGDTYTRHFGFGQDEFVQFSIDRMLESIRSGREG